MQHIGVNGAMLRSCQCMASKKMLTQIWINLNLTQICINNDAIVQIAWIVWVYRGGISFDLETDGELEGPPPSREQNLNRTYMLTPILSKTKFKGRKIYVTFRINQ